MTKTHTAKTLSVLFPKAQAFLPKELLGVEVHHLALDSREVREGSLFFALKGHSVNREHFVEAALEAGAVAVIKESSTREIYVEDVQYIDSTAATPKSGVVICVPDLKCVVGDVANIFFGQPSDDIYLVGITGTNGKTSCADMLAQAWRCLGLKAASLGTLGWSVNADEYHATGMTTLSAIENHCLLAKFRDDGITHVVMEVSSHGIDQGRLASLNFDVTAITNITRDHLDYHKSMDAYAATKLSFLVENNCPFVFNADDKEIVERLEDAFLSREHVLSGLGYSLGEKDVDLSVKNIVLGADGIEAIVCVVEEETGIRLNLIGLFNLQNFLLVLGVLQISTEFLGGKEKTTGLAAKIASKMKAIPGRVERVSTALPVYIDYAHTPDGLEKVLTALKPHTARNLILVFGCGGDRDKGKRPEMALIAERYASKIYVTNDNPRSEDPLNIIEDIQAGFTGKADVIIEPDRRLAIKSALLGADEHDVVLVAGKGHENYQEVKGVKYPFSDYDEVKRLVA